MSAESLGALHEAHAFDSAPLRDSLHHLHVPFDELIGTSACESRLESALRARHRVALVGATGSGKTSVAASVLGPLVSGLAPIAVPVFVERPMVATEPAEFAEHLVAVIRRLVRETLPAAASRASRVGGRPRNAGSRRVTVAPGWMGAKVELGLELRQAATSAPVSGTERIEHARELLEIIRTHGLAPVLVLDDTDRWLNPHWSIDPEAQRAGFFGKIVRLLAEDLATAAVIAVHPGYLADPEYRRADGFIEDRVTVPALPDEAAVGRVLARRAGLALEEDEDAVLTEVITSPAVAALYAGYAVEPNVRSGVLQIANMALTIAIDDAAEVIDEVHIAAALADS